MQCCFIGWSFIWKRTIETSIAFYKGETEGQHIVMPKYQGMTEN